MLVLHLCACAPCMLVHHMCLCVCTPLHVHAHTPVQAALSLPRPCTLAGETEAGLGVAAAAPVTPAGPAVSSVCSSAPGSGPSSPNSSHSAIAENGFTGSVPNIHAEVGAAGGGARVCGACAVSVLRAHMCVRVCTVSMLSMRVCSGVCCEHVGCTRVEVCAVSAQGARVCFSHALSVCSGVCWVTCLGARVCSGACTPRVLPGLQLMHVPGVSWHTHVHVHSVSVPCPPAPQQLLPQHRALTLDGTSQLSLYTSPSLPNISLGLQATVTVTNSHLNVSGASAWCGDPAPWGVAQGPGAPWRDVGTPRGGGKGT